MRGDSLRSVCRLMQSTGILDRFQQEAPDCEKVAPFFHRADGIHGVGHTLRVLFWVLYLGECESLPDKDRGLLTAAAKYHDIGRVNDWICEEHGFRSVTRMLEHGLYQPDEALDLHLVSFLISYHCINDAAANRCLDEDHKIADKKRARRLFHIFKDSDGLDRVRIKDLDVRYLRTEPAKILKPAAEELFGATKGRKIIFPDDQ